MDPHLKRSAVKIITNPYMINGNWSWDLLSQVWNELWIWSRPSKNWVIYWLSCDPKIELTRADVNIVPMIAHHDRQGGILIHCLSFLMKTRSCNVQIKAVFAWHLEYFFWLFKSYYSHNHLNLFLLTLTSHGSASCCRHTAFMLWELSQTPVGGYCDMWHLKPLLMWLEAIMNGRHNS